MEIYLDANDETKIVNISYTLTNAFIAYDDVIDLNHAMIGDGWDYEIERVEGTIAFQQQAAPKISAFGDMAQQTEQCRSMITNPSATAVSIYLKTQNSLFAYYCLLIFSLCQPLVEMN